MCEENQNTPLNDVRPKWHRDMRTRRQSEGITGLYRDDPAGEQFPEMEALLEVGQAGGWGWEGWGKGAGGPQGLDGPQGSCEGACRVSTVREPDRLEGEGVVDTSPT
mgnify:CR=1 FL=1